MTAKILFFVLCVLSVGCLLLGLRRKDGVFQFPVLFSAAFAFSIVPQLVNHVFYPGRLPELVYKDHGVQYGIVICILCLLAGIAGYAGRLVRPPILGRVIPDVNPEKLFWAGVVLCLIGLYGGMKLAELAGGWKEQFIGGGHYALQWSGEPVLWVYVAKLVPFGLVLCLNSALINGNLLKWSFTLLAMLYPLAVIVFLGRRTAAFGLAVTIAFSLWFQKRWAIPRPVVVLALALGGLLIIFMPYYRSYANQTGDILGAAAQLDAEELLDMYSSGEHGEGMDNLIVGIPARLAYPSFGFGSGFWNAAVDYLVPAQLLGRDFKDALLLRIASEDEDLFPGYCATSVDYASFTTGPQSVFVEFWFFGCLLFFVVARFYRQLWHVASEQRLLGAQVIYVATALLVPFSVVNSLTGCFAMFLLTMGVLMPVLWVARERGPAGARWSPVRL